LIVVDFYFQIVCRNTISPGIGAHSHFF